MTLWEYLTAPTLTHAASKSSISAQVQPTGGRKNCDAATTQKDVARVTEVVGAAVVLTHLRLNRA